MVDDLDYGANRRFPKVTIALSSTIVRCSCLKGIILSFKLIKDQICQLHQKALISIPMGDQ